MELAAVVLAVVASLVLLLGVPGNALLTVTWRMANLDNPFAVNLAAFDFITVLSGAAPALITMLVGSDWLTSHVMVCDVIAFINSHVLLGSTVALLCLLEYSCHAQNFSILRKRRKAKNSLLVCATWLVPLVASLPPLVGWGSFDFDRALGSCTFLIDVSITADPTDSWHGYLSVLAYFLLSVIACALCGRASRQLRYAAHVNWQMHMLEMRMNDPERTTAHSTSSTLGAFCAVQGNPLPPSLHAQYLEFEKRKSMAGEERDTDCPERRAGRQSIPSGGGSTRDGRTEDNEQGRNVWQREEATTAKRTLGDDDLVAAQEADPTGRSAIKKQHCDDNLPEELTTGTEGHQTVTPAAPPTSHRERAVPDTRPDGRQNREDNPPEDLTTERETEGQHTVTLAAQPTPHRQRVVPAPLRLPAELQQSFYLGPAGRRLQSPRFIRSPIINLSQHEAIAFTMVMAVLSLIGCLPIVVTSVLQLASVRCPEITRVLATLLLCVRSAVAPIVSFLRISECRRQLERVALKCGTGQNAVSKYCTRRRWDASPTEVYNHVAVDPPVSSCLSIGYSQHRAEDW